MADYSALIAELDETITSNGHGDITGAILNDVLKSIIYSLGDGYQFLGLATPAMNPGTPDQRVFYLTSTPGHYTNFGNAVLSKGIWAIRWDTEWHHDLVMLIDDEIDGDSTNPVQNATIKEALDGLLALIQGIPDTPLTLTTVTGYYIYSSGARASFSGACISNPISFHKGDIVTITANGNSAVAFIAKTNAQGSSYTPVVLGSGGTSSASTQTVQYTVDEDCYLAFSSLNSTLSGTVASYYIKSFLEQLSTINDEVDRLNANVFGEHSSETLVLNNIVGYYIFYDGQVSAFSSGRYTTPFAVTKGDVLTITSRANQNVAILSKTNSQGSSFTPLIVGTGSTSGAYWQTVEYTVEEDGYMSISSIYEDPTASVVHTNLLGLDGRLSLLEEVIGVNVLAAFDNLLCVGDSLTWSQVYIGTSTSRQAHRTYPQILAKLCSNEYTMLATAGYSAKQVWDNYKNQIVSKTNPLAIIYLGTNQGLTDTLATDVVGNNPDAWADNNIGCYCRIVQKCISLGYRVLLLKCWVTSGTGSSSLDNTNAAIEHVAELFSCAVMAVPVNHDARYHYYPDLSGQNAVHYNDLGYSWFASKLIEGVAALSESQLKLIIPT